MEKYYKELPSNYELIKVIDANDKKVGAIFTIGSLLISVIVIVLSIVLKKVTISFEPGITEFLISTSIFIVLMIGSIIVHELLHGIAYKLITKQKLTFGLTLTVAYCGVPNIYVSKKTALISLLAPFVVINTAYIISLIFLPSSLLCLYIIICFGIHFGGCIGDLYVTLLLVFKIKGQVLMNDTGPKQSFYILKKGE